VEELLLSRNLISKENGTIRLTPLARVMAEHFIGVERLSRIIRLVNEMKDPLDILADLECASDEEAAREKMRNEHETDDKKRKKKKHRGRRLKK
ncbi:MAG TPA: DEAD/DEAH box helicase, partial [Methanospirillum sp.]|nr:DEAD/DEAH box helicase [Methanospirillum sp.]